MRQLGYFSNMKKHERKFTITSENSLKFFEFKVYFANDNEKNNKLPSL